MSSHEHRKLRHARVKEILFEASELGPEARGRFLERACDGDPALRREVESLLSYFDGRSREGEPVGDRRQPGAPLAADSALAKTGVTALAATPDGSAGLNGKRKRSR